MFKIKFLMNFAGGLALGTIATLFLCWMFDSQISEDLKKLYTFIFSAIMTALAATLALAGALNNVYTQRELDRNNRLRRLNAAKANLPIALNNFIKVCKIAKNKETSELSTGFPQGTPARNFGLDHKEEAINTLTSVIENAEIREAKILSSILANHQVLVARMGEMQPERSEREILESIAYWSYQSCLISHCFNYARGDEHIEDTITEEFILSSMNRDLDGILEEEQYAVWVGVYYRSHLRKNFYK